MPGTRKLTKNEFPLASELVGHLLEGAGIKEHKDHDNGKSREFWSSNKYLKDEFVWFEVSEQLYDLIFQSVPIPWEGEKKINRIIAALRIQSFLHFHDDSVGLINSLGGSKGDLTGLYFRMLVRVYAGYLASVARLQGFSLCEIDFPRTKKERSAPVEQLVLILEKLNPEGAVRFRKSDDFRTLQRALAGDQVDPEIGNRLREKLQKRQMKLPDDREFGKLHGHYSRARLMTWVRKNELEEYWDELHRLALSYEETMDNKYVERMCSLLGRPPSKEEIKMGELIIEGDRKSIITSLRRRRINDHEFSATWWEFIRRVIGVGGIAKIRSHPDADPRGADYLEAALTGNLDWQIQILESEDTPTKKLMLASLLQDKGELEQSLEILAQLVEIPEHCFAAYRLAIEGLIKFQCYTEAKELWSQIPESELVGSDQETLATIELGLATGNHNELPGAVPSASELKNFKKAADDSAKYGFYGAVEIHKTLHSIRLRSRKIATT